jgi:hypothetical protein
VVGDKKVGIFGQYCWMVVVEEVVFVKKAVEQTGMNVNSDKKRLQK